MVLPLILSVVADTPPARADDFLGRRSRFTLAGRALAEALPQLEDDGLVTRTRPMAVVLTDRLPVPGASDWTPGGLRYVAVQGALAEPFERP